MKSLKTLAITVALTTAALVFCATSAKAGIGIVTNYDTVNFSATVTTNYAAGSANELKLISKAEKFGNKNLLTLLTNSDFAGVPFPTGSKLVLGWDAPWNGDLLVVDEGGTNVLYDATTHTANNTNSVTINLYSVIGSPNFIFSGNGEESYALTWYNNASFAITDLTSSVTLSGTGPCTDHFSAKGFDTNNIPTSWTDSQAFSMYGAGESAPNSGPVPGTLAGSITVSGNGKGFPDYLGHETMTSLIP